ncbi:MAG TPA: TonB-dependent receptor, partial [Blastocatellia bacterium]|nr:TonB-dependent receptor [Blastocatellia bacterium]
MSRFLRCLVVACLLLAGGGASAQSNASVNGSVLDANKDAVVGAVVKATHLASGLVLTAKTGAAGEYQIAGLSPGTYRLSVDKDGFTSVTRTVTLAGAVTQDFSLAPATIRDAITVTAAKGNARAALDTPQTVNVTTAQDIERERPWSTFATLERTPNLNSIAASPLLERPRLRGLDANRLLLLVDGERLNNFRSDPVSGISPGVIDVTQLESAEVVSGGGSSLYGSDAMAGTINLVTRTPARTDGAAILSLRFDGDLRSNGLFRRAATAINFSDRRLAVRLSGSRFATEDYRAGNAAVDLQEVVRLGRLANDMGNVAGNNVARTFAVWQLPARAEIANGDARGFNDQLDVWFFPSANHSIRFRQLNSQHKDIEFPFISPPFDARDQFNGFRRFDKYGLAYEGRDLARWLPRLSAGFYGQK